MSAYELVKKIAGASIASVGLSSAAPANPLSQDAAWFQNTTQRLYDAVASGDKALWQQVLDTNCTVTTEDGETLNREAFLKSLTPLPSGLSGAIKVRGLTVRLLAGSAVVHYWLDEAEEIFGQHLHTTYVETDAYRRTAHSWKIVAMQVTVVPRDLEPIEVDTRGWPLLVGDYAYSDKTTTRYHVFIRDGTLYGGRDAKTATRLIPLAPLVFFQQGSIHTMIFVADRRGAITEVRELHKYNEVRMRRLRTAMPAPGRKEDRK